MIVIKPLNMTVLVIMTAVTVLNIGLVINFITANGQSIAATFNSRSIYLFAGVELAAVLLAYILYKQKTTPTNS